MARDNNRPVPGKIETSDGSFVYQSDVSAAQVAKYGTKAIVGTSAVTADEGFYFWMIQITDDAVVADQTAVPNQTTADLSGLTLLPAGSYATAITSITLTSGEGIAYQMPLTFLGIES
jgi:hypothetical protein